MSHGSRPAPRGFQRKYLFFWLVGTVSAVLVSFAGTQGLYAGGNETSNDVPPPVPQPLTSTSSKPSQGQQVTIEAPRELTKVNGRQGVLVQGHAGDLHDSVLRLFVLAYNGQYYLIDNGPVIAPNREWRFLLKPIGDGKRDIGRVFTVFVATVDSDCRKLLDRSHRDRTGNISFTQLPPGCTAKAKVNVLKTSW
ncbi:hypothetical protein J4573_19520 [Actinomadura barringtoniae]|uniref:Uncharacterized protein n=1 Tax=Actinomadura barringtoniae TaxID=1427535 RepID=A0A939T7H6_9ACTN|nr:hypothetical protein [Actinomadura barringtoniae]MBO2449302.1 hypothetical protein [Actinomadura barringtoniae]